MEPVNERGEYEMGEHLVRASGKLQVLDVLLRKFWRQRRRVLLFCTMTRVLDVLQDFLEWRQWPALRLDGSVRSSDRTHGETAAWLFVAEGCFWGRLCSLFFFLWFVWQLGNTVFVVSRPCQFVL